MPLQYRFLFHLHTRYSHDATIGFKTLANVLVKYRITHLAITEHNHMDSFIPFSRYLQEHQIDTALVPACEYSTIAGDIIVLFHDQVISYENPHDLIRKAHEVDAITVLPHPFKREEYPTLLLDEIDLFELMNLRGTGKEWDIRTFGQKPFLFGTDAHHAIDLPGFINTYNTDLPFREALLHQVPVPLLIKPELTFIRKISSRLSRIRKWWK